MAWPKISSWKTRIPVYAAIAAGVLIIIFLQTAREKARLRDLQRVNDVLTIRSAFEQLYLHDRSYAAAADRGCNEAGQSVRLCNLRDYERNINLLKDPGKHDYLVTKVPTETDYQVTFWLETGHTGLAKGMHTISPKGIK